MNDRAEIWIPDDEILPLSDKKKIFKVYSIRDRTYMGDQKVPGVMKSGRF
jgi:hypothetical protein